MESIKNNKLFWVLVVITIFNVGAFMLGNVIVNKAADRVIQKLQKEYSPSKYGPGFDPDKVDMNGLNGVKQYYEMRQTGPSKVFREERLREADTGTVKSVVEADQWRDGWEKSRGVNP